MYLEFPVEGEEQFKGELTQRAARAKHPFPLWRSLIGYLEDIERAQFRTDGARSEHPWAPLKPATLAQKIRHGERPDILMRSDRLFDSLTGHSPYAVRIQTTSEMRFGSSVSYMKYHQSTEPRTRLPRRPLIDLTDLDRRVIEKMVSEWMTTGKTRDPLDIVTSLGSLAA